MKKLFLIFLIVISSCNTRVETEFSEKALQEKFNDVDGKEILFKKIIEKHKGKKIFIDVWASWCRDCLKAIPELKQLQKENPNVVFLYLSIDDSLEELRSGIEKYKLEGEHYLLVSKKEGDFSDFLGLSWIPRYVIVDETGKIEVFKAVKTNDTKIIRALK